MLGGLEAHRYHCASRNRLEVVTTKNAFSRPSSRLTMKLVP